MFCTNCGAANQEGARLCIHCAQSLGDVQIERRLGRPRTRRTDSLRALLDFSSTRFVSPRIMKSLFALSILFAGLMAVFLIVVGFKVSTWLGILALLLGAPLIFLLTVFSSRILLETILIIFRIAENTANIAVANTRLPATEEKSESRDGIQWNI
jgi:hypothetical protein